MIALNAYSQPFLIAIISDVSRDNLIENNERWTSATEGEVVNLDLKPSIPLVLNNVKVDITGPVTKIDIVHRFADNSTINQVRILFILLPSIHFIFSNFRSNK